MEKIKSLLSGHSSGDKHASETSQHGTGISEASTEQERRNLSTGAGTTGHQTGTAIQSTGHAGQGSHLAGATTGITPGQQGHSGVTQDTAHTAPIQGSGIAHGSGQELGSTTGAHITPGNTNDSHERSFPLSSNPASSGTAHTSTNTSGQHLGRDAAAIGTAGAVGEGIHRHRENERGVGSGTTGLTGTDSSNSGLASGSGNFGSAHGPHITHTANLLDPALNRGIGSENAIYHSEKHGGGAEEADAHHTPTITSSKGHIGRDAALASTSAGAIGVSEFERTKHHTGHSTGIEGAHNTAPTTGHNSQSIGLGGSHNTVPTTAHSGQSTGIGGTHSTAPTTGQYDQSTGIGGTHGTAATSGQYGSTTAAGSTLGSNTSQTGSHNHRDAALVGGVGAAGAGAYAVDKHLKSESRSTNIGDSGSSTITGQHAAGSSSQSAVERRADPTIDSGTSRGHHFGGDGSSAGKTTVASTAFNQAEQHRHDKDLTEAEREAKKQHKHDEKEAKREHHEAKKDHHHEKEVQKESKGGILSFLHRDKNKKYSPEEEAEFDRQEREHNSSHATRNTALGAGAVGTGVASHEASKHHNISDSTSTSAKRDIGDILHGEERNRGVVGSSGFPGEPGFGDGASASHATSDATVGQTGHTLPTRTNVTGSGTDHIPRSQLHDSTVGSNTGTAATSGHYNDSTSASGLGSKTGGTGHIGSGTTTGQTHAPAGSASGVI